MAIFRDAPSTPLYIAGEMTTVQSYTQYGDNEMKTFKESNMVISNLGEYIHVLVACFSVLDRIGLHFVNSLCEHVHGTNAMKVRAKPSNANELISP